jgi:5S rRNA maturation endonuclease (ribonuclease M5)
MQRTLVLCEGKRDASFVLHLAEQRGIDGIQVGFTNGKDGFKNYLVDLRVRRGFNSLRHIVILRDCDENGEVAFRDVVQQINEAGRYDIPTAPEVETAGTPGITVRLIPDSTTVGNLDALLLSAVDANHPLNPCFDSYFECCKLGDVSIGKASKIKLTTIVAASCHANPSCSLVWVWKETGNPIPLQSSKFDAIADFLRRFT